MESEKNGAEGAVGEPKDTGKKQVPLRLSATLWRELTAWAEDDFRSLNGQIEYLLTEAVRRRQGRAAGGSAGAGAAGLVSGPDSGSAGGPAEG